MKNCLARPICRVAFFSVSLALSGFTVSVCRGVYTNHHRTSSSFFKKIALFCKQFSKTLKNQCFQKHIFCHFFTQKRKTSAKSPKTRYFQPDFAEARVNQATKCGKSLYLNLRKAASRSHFHSNTAWRNMYREKQGSDQKEPRYLLHPPCPVH